MLAVILLTNFCLINEWVKRYIYIVVIFRSPNRKLREATDRVGDKLRAYAQKFKVGLF